MSLLDARKELAAVLKGVPELKVDDEGLITDSIVPPAAFIDFEINGALTFQHGAFDILGHVWLLVDRADEVSAGRLLDQFRDPTDENSVWRRICDHTWVDCDYMVPTGCTPATEVLWNNGNYLMVDITLEVVL